MKNRCVTSIKAQLAILAAVAFAFVFPVYGQGDVSPTSRGAGGDMGSKSRNDKNPLLQLNPAGITLDRDGNIYIADIQNSVIYTVIASTGKVVTVAGNGVRGFSGDGGPATLASLSQPQDIALDEAGNIYISDTGNLRIRKVTSSTGIITTVAGNGERGFDEENVPATATRTNWPYGITLDKEGDIYFVDHGHALIRKVIASTGIITTVAGNGTLGFSGDNGPATDAEMQPWTLALDNANNIYIADTYCHCIRKVNASDGKIHTIATIDIADLKDKGKHVTDGPTGIAVDQQSNIYFVDNGHYCIRKISAVTGNISTIAGNGVEGLGEAGKRASSTAFYFPYGLALDNHGSIYISSTAAHRVYKVNMKTGEISYIAGNGLGGVR